MAEKARNFMPRATRNWHSVLPALGVYRRGWLGRLIGPLFQGVLLEGCSGGGEYRVRTHVTGVHWSREFVSIGPLGRDMGSVQYKFHDGGWHRAFARLKEATLVGFEPEVNLEALVAVYRKEITRATYPRPAPEAEDAVTLLAWCGMPDAARELMVHIEATASLWEPVHLERHGGLATWLRRLTRLIEDPGLAERVEERIRAFGMEKLPRATLDFDKH